MRTTYNKAPQGTGYRITLYKYSNSHGGEKMVITIFDPKKVDGHAIKQTDKSVEYARLPDDMIERLAQFGVNETYKRLKGESK